MPANAKALDERLLAEIESRIPKAAIGPWVAEGRCVEVDPELWQPGPNDRGKEARAICARCEVRLQCLAYGVANARDEWGIWGGRDRRQRLRLLRLYLEREAARQNIDEAVEGMGEDEAGEDIEEGAA
jgi:WhiB family redox-sensing transcriptional regulator